MGKDNEIELIQVTVKYGGSTASLIYQSPDKINSIMTSEDTISEAILDVINEIRKERDEKKINSKTR